MERTAIDTKKKYVKMKQDVYEHLARTFLDKKKKKRPKKKKLWILLIFVIFISFVSFFSLRSFDIKKNLISKSLHVIHDKTPIVIEYDFTTAGDSKTRALSFNLDNIDLTEYNFLELSVRTGKKSRIDTTIKVKIENLLLERDAEYVSGINNRWREFSLPLESFDLIKDWSSIKVITFIAEDWNVANKNDKVFIDDVRFTE